MSLPTNPSLKDLADRFAPNMDLTAGLPLMLAIEALAYKLFRDTGTGKVETDYAAIYSLVRASLPSNATPFEVGLAVGLVLAVSTEEACS